ncbi:MAG: hypothetical protein NT167_24955 [Verrucomicrobia bacterium]|nr:hypothetical protein [Verrucomicrobiota bacterium]
MVLGLGHAAQFTETPTKRTAARQFLRQHRGRLRGLLLKDSYWRWPERNLAGSALHFQVLGLSFHDAMRQITGT